MKKNYFIESAASAAAETTMFTAVRSPTGGVSVPTTGSTPTVFALC